MQTWKSDGLVDQGRLIATLLFKHTIFNTDPTPSYSAGSFGMQVTHAFQYSAFVEAW